MAVKHVQTWVMMAVCWRSVPNGWKFPVWVDRLHSMFVFLLGFNPHVQLILIDIPWWLPDLPSIRNSCANSFEIGNNGNNPFPDHQSMEPAINGFEMFWTQQSLGFLDPHPHSPHLWPAPNGKDATDPAAPHHVRLCVAGEEAVGGWSADIERLASG